MDWRDLFTLDRESLLSLQLRPKPRWRKDCSCVCTTCTCACTCDGNAHGSSFFLSSPWNRHGTCIRDFLVDNARDPAALCSSRFPEAGEAFKAGASKAGHFQGSAVSGHHGWLLGNRAWTTTFPSPLKTTFSPNSKSPTSIVISTPAVLGRQERVRTARATRLTGVKLSSVRQICRQSTLLVPERCECADRVVFVSSANTLSSFQLIPRLRKRLTPE